MHVTRAEEETEQFARQVAELLRPGDCIALVGDLGAGKTVFARAVIQTLAGQPVEVTSPTFALMQPYDTPRGPVWHCDLYRLEDEAEVPPLGLEEILPSAITLIEWPDIAANYLPDARLTVRVGYGAHADERVIVLEGDGEWKQRLKRLM